MVLTCGGVGAVGVGVSRVVVRVRGRRLAGRAAAGRGRPARAVAYAAHTRAVSTARSPPTRARHPFHLNAHLLHARSNYSLTDLHNFPTGSCNSLGPSAR